MPEPAPSRSRKVGSAAIVIAIAAAVFWIVEKRSQPPPAPSVALPYTPPEQDAPR